VEFHSVQDGTRYLFDIEELGANDTKGDLLEKVPLAEILRSDFVIRGGRARELKVGPLG